MNNSELALLLQVLNDTQQCLPFEKGSYIFLKVGYLFPDWKDNKDFLSHSCAHVNICR